MSGHEIVSSPSQPVAAARPAPSAGLSGYGKLNLISILLLPGAAVLAALIVFGARSDTLLAVAAINAVPALLGGLISALLLRRANRAGAGQFIALWPSLLPAAVGAVWYLWRAVLPEELAPGREFLAVPQYMLIAVVVLGLVAAAGCGIARARQG